MDLAQRNTMTGPRTRTLPTAALAVLTVALSLAAPAPAEAQERRADTRLIGEICSLIGGMNRDWTPGSPYAYHYERNIYEASGVDIDNDTDEEIGEGVSALWDAAYYQLICNNTQFDVREGNILKFAVKIRFREFIEDAAMLWNIPWAFNLVDCSDGRTVLDYIEKEIDLNLGNANESVLRRYHDIVRQAGGKRRAELTEVRWNVPPGATCSSR
jgi:hypothetical protein